MRLGPQQFRVVTGGATGMMDLKWFADHLPADGSAQLTDLTSAWTTLGLWGPHARDVLQSGHRRRRVARPGSRSAPAGRSRSAALTVLASRISYVGELGWELYVADGAGRQGLGHDLGRPGRPHGLIPVGIGVYGTTGRLEKGYRAFGDELDRRLQPGRGRDGAAHGQGAAVHRQGRLPGAAEDPPARCCAR